MAAAARTMVECPDCSEEIEVPIRLESSSDGGRFILAVEPDIAPMAEHYAEAHA